MTEKVKKDKKTADNNRRLISTIAILAAVVLIVYVASMIVGGAFKDFCEAAIPWVLIGIGIAAAMTYFSQLEQGGNEKK